ncbi:hypothetical protein ZPAH1_orf00384 [Aeromonas phage ZPAH1]|nr:hypothetical protein ASwh1_339 [Aeromonas phage Aswh_1]QQG34146.1 hypothetical protein ZPAH1_orf00384 [Aeromonas phage ZPAH1]
MTYDIWFDYWNCDSEKFSSELRFLGIEFTVEESEGDSSTMFTPGLIYHFRNKDDKNIAETIYQDY